MIELFEALDAIDLLGWVGSVLAIIGTLLLALNCDYSRYGFACNLLANACLVGYAAWNNTLPILMLNGVMVVVSIVGLLRWFGPQRRLKRWQRIDFSGRRFERMLANARARQGL